MGVGASPVVMSESELELELELGLELGLESVELGGRPPKVNPTPRGVVGAVPTRRERCPGILTLEPAAGTALTGAC